MFGMASAYKKCLTSLNVKSKDALERLIHQHIRNPSVQEASHELLDIEQEWDNFFKSIDKNLTSEVEEPAKLGQTGPLEVPLVDARSGEATSLKQFLKERNSLVLILLRHFA